MRQTAFLFALLFNIQTNAQTIGVKAGLSSSWYEATSRRLIDQYYSHVTGTSFKPGFIVGGYADFQIKQNLFLRPGAELVVKGAMEDRTYFAPGTINHFKNKINFVAFDFPVKIVYKSGKMGEQGMIVGGGLVPGILIEGGLNKYDMGAGLMVGYELPSGLAANLNYNLGLLNVASNSYDYHSLKNRYLGATLGYNFKKRKVVEANKINTLEQAPVATEQKTITVQQPIKAFYAELGGPAGFLSFNMDTRLTKSHNGLGLRFGVGTIVDLDGFGFTAPVALNYLFGKNKHYLEVSGGASYYYLESNSSDRWFNFENDKFIAPFIWAGYRYQPLSKKIVFRAGFGQFIGISTPGILRIPSVSFGYSVQ